ncbi:hypothetical protein SUGI_0939730 [Cryptomeria japonica]|nr:hypothetical protein SUGI_0939730 [Cryptomeria japonica]
MTNWSTGSGEWKEVNLGAGREQRELSQNLGDSSGWPYHKDGMQQSALTLSPKLAIPQPELKPFASKSRKTEPILPASKWTREDEGGDVEGKQDAQGLGLGYSSSGSEDSHGIEKGERQEATVDSFPLANEHRNSSSKKHAHSHRSHSMSPHKASRDRERERKRKLEEAKRKLSDAESRLTKVQQPQQKKSRGIQDH